ncbi:MAG: hypothetical protein HY721_14545 [Planctomycetes bacterium]|nr:hypothetical protein [Planctomycetota bacterium]
MFEQPRFSRMQATLRSCIVSVLCLSMVGGAAWGAPVDFSKKVGNFWELAVRVPKCTPMPDCLSTPGLGFELSLGFGAKLEALVKSDLRQAPGVSGICAQYLGRDGGFLELDFGAELVAQFCWSLPWPLQGLSGCVDIPYIPVFDWRIQDTDAFNDLLLCERAYVFAPLAGACVDIDLSDFIVPIPGVAAGLALCGTGDVGFTLKGSEIASTSGGSTRHFQCGDTCEPFPGCDATIASTWKGTLSPAIRAGVEPCFYMEIPLIGRLEVCLGVAAPIPIPVFGADWVMPGNTVPEIHLPRSTWYRDVDGDGHGDPRQSVQDCVQRAGYVAVGDDCDDSDPRTYPGAPESCDCKDNDCDGATDEGYEIVLYEDRDGDGRGNPAISKRASRCCPHPGWVENKDDCNDGDPTIYRGAPELCDCKDNDCDGSPDEDHIIVVYRDADGDGRGNPAVSNRSSRCCPHPGFVENADDCNDADATVYRGAPELCDCKDNDCDGTPDDGHEVTVYEDRDSDTFGNAGVSKKVSKCCPHPGFVEKAGDCDDLDAKVYPGAPELCDCRDNDCDGTPDDGHEVTVYQDGDGDRFGNPRASKRVSRCCPHPGFVEEGGDCDDGDPTAYPGAPELCDCRDNDCDGTPDDGHEVTVYQDGDGDGFGNGSASKKVSKCCPHPGFVEKAGDCDDLDAKVYPGAPELCDCKDNDCNGTPDEGHEITVYEDRDGDGFGNAGVSKEVSRCCPHPGFVERTEPCDDSDPTVYPGAQELCDCKDNDCDGTTDEGHEIPWYRDRDSDGHGDPGVTLRASRCCAPAGYVQPGDDCNDSDPTIHPGAEEPCDGIDRDCDGEGRSAPDAPFAVEYPAQAYLRESVRISWSDVHGALRYRVEAMGPSGRWVTVCEVERDREAGRFECELTPDAVGVWQLQVFAVNDCGDSPPTPGPELEILPPPTIARWPLRCDGRDEEGPYDGRTVGTVVCDGDPFGKQNAATRFIGRGRIAGEGLPPLQEGADFFVGLWFHPSLGSQEAAPGLQVIFGLEADPASTGGDAPPLFLAWDGAKRGLVLSRTLDLEPLLRADGLAADWHHVAVSRAAGKLWLYVDAAPIGSRDDVAPLGERFAFADRFDGGAAFQGSLCRALYESRSKDRDRIIAECLREGPSVYVDEPLEPREVSIRPGEAREALRLRIRSPGAGDLKSLLTTLTLLLELRQPDGTEDPDPAQHLKLRLLPLSDCGDQASRLEEVGVFAVGPNKAVLDATRSPISLPGVPQVCFVVVAEASLDAPYDSTVRFSLKSASDLGVADEAGRAVFVLGRRTDEAPAVTGNKLVVSPNQAPEVQTAGDQVVREGDTVTLDGSDTSDPEGDPLSFRWTQRSGRPVALEGADSPVATFIAPEVDEEETLEFELLVGDGWVTATGTVRVTVLPVCAVRLKAKIAGEVVRQGEQDPYTFHALAGALLTIKLKATGGNLVPDLVLLDPEGNVLDLSPFRRVSKKGVEVRKLPLRASGEHTVVVRGRDATAGSYLLSLAGKHPKAALSLKKTYPVSGSGDLLEERFEGIPGMKMVLRLSGRRCDPDLLEVLDPDGRPVVPEALRAGTKSEGLRATLVEAGGYTVRFKGTPGGDGAYLSLRIKLTDPPVLKARECTGP